MIAITDKLGSAGDEPKANQPIKAEGDRPIRKPDAPVEGFAYQFLPGSPKPRYADLAPG